MPFFIYQIYLVGRNQYCGQVCQQQIGQKVLALNLASYTGVFKTVDIAKSILEGCDQHFLDKRME